MNITELAVKLNVSLDEAKTIVETAILDYAEGDGKSQAEYWLTIADTLYPDSEIAREILAIVIPQNATADVNSSSGGMGASAIASIEEGMEQTIVLGSASLQDTQSAQLQLDLANANLQGTKTGYAIALTRHNAIIRAQREINNLTTVVGDAVSKEIDDALFSVITDTVTEMQKEYSATCQETGEKKQQVRNAESYVKSAAARILGLRTDFFNKAQ